MLTKSVSTFLQGDRNKHRYVVAAQSQVIRQRLRQVPSVPLVHVKRSVMVLEPISDVTQRAKADVCIYY